MSKISVIIPVYNSAKYLQRCIESVIFQSYKNLEIILIDDCSKDNSYEICKSFESVYDNIIVYKNEKNMGVSNTRNKGLRVAKGDYICFVDSDDWVDYNYCIDLYETIINTNSQIAICGFLYIDLINDKNVQQFNYSPNNLDLLKKNDCFELYNKVLLQSPCNKLFVREIIEQNKIKFDEKLFIGEDLRFCIDYLSKIKIDKIPFLNKPNYIYCKSTNSSLMGQVGRNDINEVLKNVDMLYSNLIEQSKENFNCYENIKKLKIKNHIYSIVSNKNVSKSEKKALIFQLKKQFDSSLSNKYILKIKKMHTKNEIYLFILKVRQAIKLKIELVKKLPYKYRIYNFVKKSKNNFKDITILSQNCLGGIIYSDMNQMFLSPTINLFFESNDFLKFVNNLDFYLNCNIQMHWERWPIGVLGDIKVNFMHYNSCEEAMNAWNNRKQRVNLDKIFVLCTDRDGFNNETYELWKTIKYPKLLLTNKEEYSLDSMLFKEYRDLPHIPDIIGNRKIYKNNVLVNKLNESFMRD